MNKSRNKSRNKGDEIIERLIELADICAKSDAHVADPEFEAGLKRLCVEQGIDAVWQVLEYVGSQRGGAFVKMLFEVALKDIYTRPQSTLPAASVSIN